MTAEPRTLRTKAEEALAALYRASRGRRCPAAMRRAPRRDAAFSLFERFGLPHRRVEAWKYTDLRALTPKRRAARRHGSRPRCWQRSPKPTRSPALDRAQIVIANGVFEPELSDLDGVEGVDGRVAGRMSSPRAPERVGRLFDDGDDTVIALNTALMQGGAVVDRRRRRAAGAADRDRPPHRRRRAGVGLMRGT